MSELRLLGDLQLWLLHDLNICCSAKQAKICVVTCTNETLWQLFERLPSLFALQRKQLSTS
jgi:hypothetical protein